MWPRWGGETVGWKIRGEYPLQVRYDGWCELWLYETCHHLVTEVCEREIGSMTLLWTSSQLGSILQPNQFLFPIFFCIYLFLWTPNRKYRKLKILCCFLRNLAHLWFEDFWRYAIEIEILIQSQLFTINKTFVPQLPLITSIKQILLCIFWSTLPAAFLGSSLRGVSDGWWVQLGRRQEDIPDRSDFKRSEILRTVGERRLLLTGPGLFTPSLF